MRQLILLIFCFMSSSCLFAQKNIVGESSFSHFYFVLDSTAYQTLRTNSFCKDSLFYSQEGKAVTDQGSWAGNYLTGYYDYMEVMNEDASNSIVAGSIGLGNMLHRPPELKQLQLQWQQLIDDSIQTVYFTEKLKDTIIVELMNYRDSMLTGGKACFFVMYYHPKIMLQSGFSKKTWEAGITQEMMNKIGYGKMPEKRLYKKIEKITLNLTAHEFKRHRIALKAMGYQQSGKLTYKKEIEIAIIIKKNPAHRLQQIDFSLNRSTNTKKIKLSNAAFIQVAGDKGKLVIK